MQQELQFRISSALKNIIGRDLINELIYAIAIPTCFVSLSLSKTEALNANGMFIGEV